MPPRWKRIFATYGTGTTWWTDLLTTTDGRLACGPRDLRDTLLERKDGYWFWKEIPMRCKTYKTDGAVNTDWPPYTSAVD